MTAISFAEPDLCEETRSICAHHGDRREQLIEILHEIQAANAHVPQEAIPTIAYCLNITRAEVIGVMSFYDDFHESPAPAATIQVCRAESCQASGCDDLIAGLESRLGVRLDADANANGVALRSIFCLGNCPRGPAAIIGTTLHGEATVEALAKDADKLASGARRQPGTVN